MKPYQSFSPIARYNIRCNAVLPGFIETPMVQSVPDKVKEKFKALIPFGRMGLPEGFIRKKNYSLGESKHYSSFFRGSRSGTILGFG